MPRKINKKTNTVHSIVGLSGKTESLATCLVADRLHPSEVVKKDIKVNVEVFACDTVSDIVTSIIFISSPCLSGHYSTQRPVFHARLDKSKNSRESTFLKCSRHERLAGLYFLSDSETEDKENIWVKTGDKSVADNFLMLQDRGKKTIGNCILIQSH